MSIELLDDEDALIPAAAKALTEIFARFDVDQDGALNLQELNAFATATNGKPFDQESIDEIQEYFNCTDDGALTLIGFFEMYQMQTLSEPEETWKDLKRHGYDDNLVLRK
ncbi:uncharacterized protein BJ171DRAFT_517844 [Polychytrium aggregatum]|uniref:uncharacterized protein n=1 Tax=Polychytrium aggregatum TaxID=110093 RepID=UPI0022FDE64D|nr:uncharacterized protein BJ171DRAFT_517844 [Polychytrium aggregatum]KAI9199531.1 hypothetical protein BJ171DRAFT_517844 [Polychytrium aggregatum]